MKAKQVTYLLAGALTLVGVGSTVQAAWIAPTGGWQVNYEASNIDGYRPDQASPAWSRYQYQVTDSGAEAYSAIQTDTVTGEKTLYMDNTGTTSKLANYNLASSNGGKGSATDQVTVDFRFRLLDGTQADTQDQFSLYVARPQSLGNKLYFINFAENHIHYYNHSTSGGFSTLTYDIGLDWHDARLLIDVPNDSASLYLDGASTPLFTFGGAATTANQVQFGDGSGSVIGKAELSYYRLTNNELAAVPEPASLGLLALGGSMLLLKRRRRA